LASQILSSLSKEHNGPYASNWLERLRQIKRIQSKVVKLENNGQSNNGEPTAVGRGNGQMTAAAMAAASRPKMQMSDFTEYT